MFILKNIRYNTSSGFQEVVLSTIYIVTPIIPMESYRLKKL